MKSLFEQNGGTYSEVGDYLLPDLTIETQTINHIGKYGRLHKEYLKKHKNGIYAGLLITGKLSIYLAEIDTQAHDMLELLMKQMADLQGITEALKASDQIAWVGTMNSIKNQAEEIVFSELVYR